MSDVPPGMVRLDPSRGSSLTLIIGGDPDRSGGVGGWQPLARAGRRPGMWWQDRPNDVMSWELILDIDAIPGPSVERRLNVLYAMGRRRGRDEPPTIRLLGDVDPIDKRLTWVLQDITKGPVLRQAGGTIRRQRVTVSLEGYDEVESIEPVRVKRTRTKSGRRRRRTIRSRKGDTLRAIALRELGSATAWKDLVEWNKKRFADTDPDATLRTGVEVTIR